MRRERRITDERLPCWGSEVEEALGEVQEYRAHLRSTSDAVERQLRGIAIARRECLVRRENAVLLASVVCAWWEVARESQRGAAAQRLLVWLQVHEAWACSTARRSWLGLRLRATLAALRACWALWALATRSPREERRAAAEVALRLRRAALCAARGAWRAWERLRSLRRLGAAAAAALARRPRRAAALRAFAAWRSELRAAAAREAALDLAEGRALRRLRASTLQRLRQPAARARLARARAGARAGRASRRLAAAACDAWRGLAARRRGAEAALARRLQAVAIEARPRGLRGGVRGSFICVCACV